ncbi:restriction endonuclease subunit S [Kaistella palustris]|uniref:restriction endonuclease subunit S n=1 Tax=Kaistella palustris TaxID=493376 RepID=UPI0003FF388F|nr:restriction endonuclease subunit S [Kaistella palustris]
MEIKNRYKQTSIGFIPNDWEVRKLSSLGVFFKGKGVPKDKLTHEGFKCITYGDLYTKYNYVIKNVQSFIGFETAAISQEIKYGDICFAGSGETLEDIGKCAAFIDGKTGYAGGDIIVYRTEQNPIAFSYLLNSDIVHRQKFRLGQGHSIVHIYSSQLEKIKIPLPPLPEQQKIAEILSTWDTAIETCQKTIENLKNRNKGLAQQLLSGKKRIQGFNQEWKEHKLGDFIEEHNEKPKATCDYIIFTSSNKGLIPQTDYYSGGRMTQRLDVDYNVIPPNHITYRSRSDDGLFTFNLNTSSSQGLISGYYPVFKIKNGQNLFFIKYLNFYKKKLTKYSNGTSQLVLSIKALKGARFSLPENEEQIKIIEVLQMGEDELIMFQSKLKDLQKQKKGLMQQLLTGKVRTI